MSRALRTKLRLHADDHVEKFFALDDLRGGLTADGGLNDGFDVGDVDAIASDFGAVGVDDQAGLAQFANHGEFLEAVGVSENVANFDGFLFQNARDRGRTFLRRARISGRSGLRPRRLRRVACS